MSQEFLIMDCVGYGTLSLNENSKTNNGVTKFRGKFQEANTVNKNKRMYPESVLRRESERLIEAIDARGLVGELDHPTDSIIHFENASHIVTKLWWEGNVLMGEGEVLDTPSGKILRSLINQGVRVGISSRGVGNGSTNEDGVLVIGESYKLITFDAVADPSTPRAFQKRISGGHHESIAAEPIYRNDSRYEPVVIESAKQKISKDAIISFIGHLMEYKLDQLKRR